MSLSLNMCINEVNVSGVVFWKRFLSLHSFLLKNAKINVFMLNVSNCSAGELACGVLKHQTFEILSTAYCLCLLFYNSHFPRVLKIISSKCKKDCTRFILC